MVNNIEVACDIAKQQVNRDETCSALRRTLWSSIYGKLIITLASIQTSVNFYDFIV